MDRIGSLPEEVLCHILSFLTTKEAALTSILSKRWRNLFTLLPNLDIDDSVFLNPEEGKREKEGILQSFMDFVDRVLSLQGDNDTPIVKLSLKCKTGIDTDRVNRWISNVLQRGATSLDLVLDFPRDTDSDSDYMYLLPDEMFQNTKLVELSLRSEFDVDWWRDNTFLPMLKTLFFESKSIVLFDDLQVFLSGLPALEEFHVADIEWNVSDESVSSQSLKKLTIYASGFEDWRNPKSISFDTPNLVYLEYSDYVAADYPKVNMPSLAEAVLDFKVTTDQIELIRAPDDEGGVSLRPPRNVWKLLNGLRNVQKLFISAETLEVLSLCCESMPVFNNLKTLRIVCDEDLGWQAMPALLRNCPHLETLILEGLLHHVTDKCGDVCDCIPRDDKGRSLSSCTVKKLQIRGIQGTVREKDMIRHFLESFPCLDQMKVYADDNQNDNNDPTNVEVNKEQLSAAETIFAELDEEYKEMAERQQRVLDAMFDRIVDRNPMIASALKARESAATDSEQEKKRDFDALMEIAVDLYPDFASALRARSGTDLERGEPSRDQGEMA